MGIEFDALSDPSVATALDIHGSTSSAGSEADKKSPKKMPTSAQTSADLMDDEPENDSGVVVSKTGDHELKAKSNVKRPGGGSQVGAVQQKVDDAKAAPGNALLDAKAAVDEQQDIAKAKVDLHGQTS